MFSSLAKKYTVILIISVHEIILEGPRNKELGIGIL